MSRFFVQKQQDERPLSPNEENVRLISDLRGVGERIEMMYELFNLTSDHDMIEFYIHEINALDAHYRFLLRNIRGKRIHCPAELMNTMEVYEKLG